MRVIDEDNVMHGVVMVMVSEHGAGVSCGFAKLNGESLMWEMGV